MKTLKTSSSKPFKTTIQGVQTSRGTLLIIVVENSEMNGFSIDTILHPSSIDEVFKKEEKE